MRLRTDERGVAIQVGVALLLAIVVVALSLYQVNVVPQENQQTEFQHNQRVHDQLQEVRDAVVSVPGGGNGRSVAVQLGTSYRPRTLFLSPPDPAGRISTTGAERIEIANATADGEIGDYWNGSTRGVWTRALVYEADYNEYRDAPRVFYENTVLFDDNPTADVPRTDQTLIDGNTITLVALNGTLSQATAGTVSLDLRAASSSTRTVAVGNDTDPIAVTIPTRLPASTWENDLLADEPNVTAVGTVGTTGDGTNLVEITLSPGNYRLRMAKVGVGRNVETEESAYITDVDGDGASVPTGGNRTLAVEVRDRFNNPLSGTDVEAAVIGSGNGAVTPAAERTDAQGRATFTYRAPSTPGSARIEVKIAGTTAEDDRVVFDVNVGATGGGNGASAFRVNWTDASASTGTLTRVGDSRYVLDAGGSPSGQATLTLGTDPTADGAQVQFALNNSTTASVTPDDDTTDSDGNASTTFEATANGTYAVFGIGGGDGDSVVVEVTGIGSPASNQPPNADFTADCSGLSCSFDGSGSSDPDGDSLSYSWTFGDGTSKSGETTTHTYDTTGTYAVSLTVDDGSATDQVTKPVTVAGTVISAFQPDPQGMSDGDGEFVRVYFPRPTDVTGWTITDTESESTALPGETVDGEVYFARDADAFANQRGIDPARVYDLDTVLEQGGERIELRDADGDLVDQAAYGAESTTNGWSLSLGEGDVAVRKAGSDTKYVDTNAASDWTVESEDAFFADNAKPNIQSASLPDRGINASEATGSFQQNLSVTFDEDMDRSVPPALDLVNVSEGGDYSVVDEGWTGDRTYEWRLDFQQNPSDTPVSANVSGAKDLGGNEMDRETALTFRIDTDRPPDVPEALLRTKFVNASNQDAVEVDVRIPGSLDGDEETLLFTVGGPSRSGEISFRRPLTAAAGDLQSVTLDLSSLPEGKLSAVRAFLLDEVNNSGSYAETSQPIKDSVAPTISGFAVSADGRDLDVAFDASENMRAPTPPEYENVTVVVANADGTEVARLGEDDFGQNQAGSVYEYTDTLRDLPYGPYEVRLLSAVDPFGNAGNAGQSRSVYVGPNRIVEDFEGGTDLSSNLNFTGGDGGDVGIRADGTTQGGDSVGTVANSGTNAAYLGDSGDDLALVSRALDTTGQGTVEVSWAFKEGDDTSTPDPGEGEELFVEYRDRNGNWQNIASYAPQGTDSNYEFGSATLTAADALHDEFAVRFRQPSSSADDPWYVDDICILPGGGTCPFGDSTPPTLSGLSVSRVSSLPLSSSPPDPAPEPSFDVTASFTADEQLSSFDATVTAPGGGTTLTKADFTETPNGDGTYTYTLKPASEVAATDDGSFDFSVTNAEDAAGNAASGSTSATLQYFGSYYEYYHVDIQGADPPTADYMPDYESLTPLGSGVADEFTVDANSSRREEKFGYRYFAYVYVDRAGTYTFYTTSDDGSDLAIGNEYVVTNRGDHSSKTESGTYTFDSPGWYNLTVRYYENTGEENVGVEYDGPSVNRQAIPETNLVPRTPSPVKSTATPATPPSVVTYVDANGGDQGDLQTIGLGGTGETTYPTSSQVTAIGPRAADLAGGSDLEVPYRDNAGGIRAVDASGNEEPLVGDVRAKPKSISVGDVDDDPATEVVFVDDSDQLRHSDAGSTGSTLLRDGSGDAIGAQQVVGVEDFDADRAPEVVFLGSNNGNLRYYNLDDSTVVDTGVTVGAPGVGQPADLDDDGDLEVAYVSGNRQFTLVDDEGTDGTVSTAQQITDAPLAVVADETGNGVPEIVYIANNNKKIRYVDAVSGAEGQVDERADNSIGAA